MEGGERDGRGRKLILNRVLTHKKDVDLSFPSLPLTDKGSTDFTNKCLFRKYTQYIVSHI